jgi:hypothetical protein
MDERDFWGIVGCILGLTAVGLLHARLIAILADDAAELRADVSWLKDNTVAHETEARPGLCFSNTSSA